MSRRKLKEAMNIVDHHLEPHEIDELIKAAQAHRANTQFDSIGSITALQQVSGMVLANSRAMLWAEQMGLELGPKQ